MRGRLCAHGTDRVRWGGGQKNEIRTILGCPRLGITLIAAHVCLAHAGARVALHEDWSLDDLREALVRGHYPIVGVERHLLGHPPASHAIVVVQITSLTVHVLDPVERPQPHHPLLHMNNALPSVR